MSRRRRILIVGGYGTFGGRLALLLADEPRLTLIIAGRSHDKAAIFCNALPPGAERIAASFDRDGDVDRQLRALAPDVLVDATGPFQAYAGDPYRLVKACIAHGIDYLDLADGSDFVMGIRQFDAAAQAANIVVLSGVSSFPVLTAAVVRDLSRDLARLDAVTGGIAPSPYAGVGLNVIRAIASYAGKPVRLTRGARPAVGYALVETLRYTISPPGRVPLRNIRFSLVDVPDLQALPQLWPDLRSVWMGAGPVPEILHRALNGLAWLVRLRVLPSLSPFAALFHAAINLLRWGEHRGGMFVAIEGVTRDGKSAARSWHLLAEGDDGPLIPSMAVAIIIRQSLDGTRRASGARPAVRDIELADYQAAFARRAIHTGRRDEPGGGDAPLYRTLLGAAWSQLPAPLRAMHDLQDTMVAAGIATIERGRGWPSRLAAWIAGFPPAGADIPVRVSFTRQREREIWRRDFGGVAFSSTQEAGRGRDDRLLVERFGPFAFGLALVLDGDKLRLVTRGWSLFGLRLPAAWAPRGDAYESAQDGRFHFDVEIRHPLTGLIAAYRGWLVPQPPV
ncbi:MAG TPA: DUF4166 domain-containing protein, partial [Stellaceae bacterium]